MAERKTTIYYNHNFYYDFSQIIAADDRGLQFGDGCYEWIRVYKGHPFALSYHTDRLYRSMRLLGIRPVTAPDEFTEIVETVVEESGIEEGYVKIIVTRGQGDHDFLIPARNQLRPNVLVYAKPISLDAIAKVQDGVKCITMKDDRGHHCDILSLSQVDNLLARQDALKQGCYDGIFIRDSLLTEATHSNVLIVKAGVIWTPGTNEFMTRGITRSLVLSRQRHGQPRFRNFLKKIRHTFFSVLCQGFTPPRAFRLFRVRRSGNFNHEKHPRLLVGGANSHFFAYFRRFHGFTPQNLTENQSPKLT